MLNLDNPVEIVLNGEAVYPARIICCDLSGDEPIAVEWGDFGFIATFRNNGTSKLGTVLRNRQPKCNGWDKQAVDGGENISDAITLSKKRTAWFAVGISAGQPYTSIHATEEDAKKWAADFYPALTASIEWEDGP